MDLSIAVLSKPGGRPVNEDACGYWTSDSACCCVVSDGLGGYRGGQVASQLVVSSVLRQFASRPDISGDSLGGLLSDANEALIEEKRDDPTLKEMRATAVILAIDFSHGEGNWAHLGDTRLYCFRQGQLLTRTADHSYLQGMVNLGHLDTSQVRNHPLRNLLLGALGSKDEFTPSVQAQPMPVHSADAFLLCTDGFWQYVEDDEMMQALSQAHSADDWLERMETLLLARAARGHDNYSAVGVWLGFPGAMPGVPDAGPQAA